MNKYILHSLVTSHSDNEAAVCPFCNTNFIEDVILVVQCPVCFSLYHLNCWRANNQKCALFNCEGEQPVTAPLEQFLAVLIKQSSDHPAYEVKGNTKIRNKIFPPLKSPKR